MVANTANTETSPIHGFFPQVAISAAQTAEISNAAIPLNPPTIACLPFDLARLQKTRCSAMNINPEIGMPNVTPSRMPQKRK